MVSVSREKGDIIISNKHLNEYGKDKNFGANLQL